MNRRGVALLELVLAITMLALLGAGVAAVVRGASTVTRRAMNALASERSLLSTAVLLRHELRDAAWSTVPQTGSTISFRRRVGEGSTCLSAAGMVRIAGGDWAGERTPVPGRDRLLAVGDDGIWRESSLLTLSPTSCPDGRQGWLLALGSPLDSVRWVRAVEPTVLRRYRSGPDEWLGLEPADGSASVQPFAGPLLPGGSAFLGVLGLLEIELALPSGTRDVRLPLDQRP